MENSRRRVKCDEATPICRRCYAGGFQCQYDGSLIPFCNQDADVNLRLEAKAPGTEFQLHRSDKRDKRILIEAEPPHWDYVQMIRYYYEIIRPGLPAKGGVYHSPDFSLATAPFFTAQVIGTQLGFMSKTWGRTLRYEEDRATLATLWASHNRYQAMILALANQSIRENTIPAKLKAMRCIFHLTSTDLAVESAMWKAHVDGAFAYVEAIGGPKALADWSPETPVNFIRFFRLGYSKYTDRQLEIFMDDTDFSYDKPFPVAQKVVLVHLTRLRYQIAISAVSDQASKAIVLQLFEKLNNIDIEAWAQNVQASEPWINKTMAKMAHDAIWLYAILSLPRRVILGWIETQAPLTPAGSSTADAYDTYRVLYRSRLLAQMRKLQPDLKYTQSLSWYLIVAGVAAADGPAEDRSFIESSLYANWQRPVGAAGVFQCIRKLREFWAWDKTGWEACFYEPTPC
ncbi:hypothetical protein PWT90_03995 [Aphanocladium album]|nr:hypothetical protein PWT90_03995 [Aphanocladium album]